MAQSLAKLCRMKLALQLKHIEITCWKLARSCKCMSKELDTVVQRQGRLKTTSHTHTHSPANNIYNLRHYQLSIAKKHAKKNMLKKLNAGRLAGTLKILGT